MLTVNDLLSEVRLASGAQNARAELSDLKIVSQALQHFNTMHAWETMVRPEVDLSLVAGQSYLTLPDDVRDVIHLGYNQGLINWFKFTTAARITELRAADADDNDFAGGYWGAAEYRVPTSGGRPVKAISLYPKPASSVTDAFVLRYRANLLVTDFTGGNADTTYLFVVDELQPLVRRLVRIFAEAYYHRDGADLEHRLEALENSSMLDRIKEVDAAMQTELGVLEGGAASTQVMETAWWDSSLGEPS